MDNILGPESAPVTIVEYGDYECPYCAAAEPVLREVVTQADGRARLIFRNFPLADMHPYALTAALAAEATAPHGRFWQMHELLFAHQDRLRDSDLASYAQSLGIDGASVVGAAAQAFGDKVEDDFEAGVADGVAGTPSLFIAGTAYTGRTEVDAILKVVTSARA